MGRSRAQKRSANSYSRLEPRVVNVPEATVRKKWKKLPPSTQSAIRELVNSAKEQSRSRRSNATIDSATEECVQDVVDNLMGKLPRILYPPATDDQHFDHEANLHRIQRIEQQLDSNTHSVSLLGAQLVKEEALLRQDMAEVEYLERSLRSTESLRRQQDRSLHPLARRVRSARQDVDLLALENQDIKLSTPPYTTLFQDKDLLPVLEQLQNHLDNMHKSVLDIKQVEEAVEDTSLSLTTFMRNEYTHPGLLSFNRAGPLDAHG